MRLQTAILSILVVVGIWSCENRAINEGEEFKPKEIHEKIDYHFDNIEVDGIEYLILSRDNNNPHEGFGFMAFRANSLVQKQDSILAYMRAMAEFQTEIHARLYNQSPEQSRARFDELLNQSLNEYPELSKIGNKTFRSDAR